jgi:hypothetical protein
MIPDKNQLSKECYVAKYQCDDDSYIIQMMIVSKLTIEYNR